jgi:DNA polymerase-3 subunit alpha
LVATNDCHYLKKEDAEMHDALLCIQIGKTMKDEKRLKFDTKELYFKSPAEMAEAFHDLPEALGNSLAIAELCNVEFLIKPDYVFPALKLEKGRTSAAVLAEEAMRGLERRFDEEALAGRAFDEDKKEAYRTRLKEEIFLIRLLELE